MNNNPSPSAVLEGRLALLYEQEDIAEWFTKPHCGLQGRTPNQAISDGDTWMCHRVLDRMTEQAFAEAESDD